jgi:hypothetical protein
MKPPLTRKQFFALTWFTLTCLVVAPLFYALKIAIAIKAAVFDEDGELRHGLMHDFSRFQREFSEGDK